jgi:hypothetical protein
MPKYSSLHPTLVVARKHHSCQHCLKGIEVGDDYYRKIYYKDEIHPFTLPFCSKECVDEWDKKQKDNKNV